MVSSLMSEWDGGFPYKAHVKTQQIFFLSFVRKCQLHLVRELIQAWDTHKYQMSECIWESGASDALSQVQMDCKGCAE